MSEARVQKIAFVGTSCIGKTALLEYYQQRYENDARVAFAEEAARLFFSTHQVGDRFSEETQGRVQDLALHLEREAQASGAARLYCDRSVLDAPAYVRALGDVEGSQRLLARVMSWLPSYDALILLDPADIPYATDEIRTESATTREQFHNGFLELFEHAGIIYHLVGGTIPDRVEQIDAITG
jgi:nicotinamide riboside kinase